MRTYLISPNQVTPTPNTPERDRVYEVLEDPKERGRDQDGKGAGLKGDYVFLAGGGRSRRLLCSGRSW